MFAYFVILMLQLLVIYTLHGKIFLPYHNDYNSNNDNNNIDNTNKADQCLGWVMTKPFTKVYVGPFCQAHNGNKR